MQPQTIASLIVGALYVLIVAYGIWEFTKSEVHDE